MTWVHRSSLALGVLAAASALFVSARYALGPFLPTPEQTYFQLLPGAWLVLRVVHFALLGLVELFSAVRPTSRNRAGILTAAGLLLLYQGIVAALNFSAIEIGLFYGGVAGLAAAILALAEARSFSGFGIGLTGAVIGFGMIVVLYGLFPRVP